MSLLNKYLKETAKYALRSPWVIRSYINEVEALYAMSPEQLRERNEKRFLEIFCFAYDNSLFYHRLYKEAGINKEDITCLDDLSKLPIVTKDMVKRYGLEMLTTSPQTVIKGNTSGTTGTPLSVYRNWKTIWTEQAFLYCARKRNGFTYGQRLVSLRGNLDKQDMSLKVHISNTLYLSSYNIAPKNVQFYYNQINEFQPVAIEGYPSSLYALALILRDAGLKLSIPVAFTSSETLLDYQRSVIEELFGTEIFDLYGMTEGCISLNETANHNGYYEIPGYSINEYFEDGVICTSLINMAFPLIRYRINDMIEIADVKLEKNPQIVVKSIEGRKDDFILCKDGSRIKRLDFLFKGIKNVRFSQLMQDENDLLHIIIVPEIGFSLSDKKQLECNLLDRVSNGNLDYVIELINEAQIKYGSRGQLKYNISFTHINTGRAIKRIIGRMDDYVICKDGSRVSRIDFIENGNHIKACQWIQREKGKIEIRIVPDYGFTDKDRLYVIHETERKVGYKNIDIEIVIVPYEKLIYSSRGKFKLIVNQTSIISH